MLNREAVRDFVVNVLGCGCPESVFQTIEVLEGEVAVSAFSLLSRINIGNRLLVWLVAADDLKDPAEQLQALVREGMAERNKRGFNRFRLVLLSAEEGANGDELKQVVHAFAPPDERTHLHIIPAKAAEGILH